MRNVLHSQKVNCRSCIMGCIKILIIIQFFIITHGIQPWHKRMSNPDLDWPISVSNFKEESPENSTSADQTVCTDQNCLNNTKLSEINKLNLSALGLDSQVDGKAIGIDVHELGNLTEIEQILINDTGLEQLANTSFLDDRRAFPGSYILPILKKQKYDSYAPPVIIQDLAVSIKFGIHILSISDFKNAEMEFTMLVELRMQWRDVRLKHTFQPYILIRQKNITDQIWRPDPYFVNEKRVKLFDVTFPNTRMAVFPDGLISYVTRMKIVPACHMSFCRFPQDRQHCKLMISSMGYPREMIEFTWFDENPVEMEPGIHLPELQLVNTSWEYCYARGNIMNTSCLRIVFDFQRSMESHILRKFAPSFAALLFAWAGAYVPQHFGDIRVVTPVTILLTLKQLQRSNEDMPNTSYLTSLDIWFSVVEIFTILALMETMLVYGVSRRVRYYRKSAKYSSSTLARQRFEEKAATAEKYANILDYSSRFLFPVLFAVFAIVYAMVIAKGDQYSCTSQSSVK